MLTMFVKIIAAFMLVGVVAGRVNRPYNEARMREALLQECQKYGQEEHVDEVANGLLAFIDCMYDLANDEALSQLRLTQNSELPENVITFVKTACKLQPRIATCFNNVIDKITLCTDPKEKSRMDAGKQSILELMDLFCKDDSKIFSEFINDGAISCMEEHTYPLRGCVEKLQTLNNYKTLSADQGCVKLVEVPVCITEILEKCPKPSTANFFKEAFRIAFKGSPCTNPSGEDNKIAVNVI